MDMVQILEGYRNTIIGRLKFEPRTKGLFAAFIGEIRKILHEHKLPSEVLAEIRRILRETFDVLRELAKDTTAEDNVEVLAKRIIETTKQAAYVVLPAHEVRQLRYEQVPTSDVLQFDDVEDSSLRKRLKESLGTLVLPKGECGYKGGAARATLKLWVFKRYPEFNRELLEAELPLSDKDAVFGPNIDAWKTAQAMGVDPDGVERTRRFDEQGIIEHLNSRDVDMNQAFLTRRFLYFTPEAIQSVLSGVIHCAGRAKTLFGVDTFGWQGRLYFTNKILNRLVIAVCRNRAHYFELPRYNCDVQLGIYWLVLIRKVWGKPDSAVQIAKIFDCARQMGQTGAGTPKEFIQELMERYRFFSFRSNQSTEDIARWILSKYTTLIHRHLKGTFKLYPPWEYTSTDETPMLIRPDISTIEDEQQHEALEYLNDLVRAQSPS